MDNEGRRCRRRLRSFVADRGLDDNKLRKVLNNNEVTPVINTRESANLLVRQQAKFGRF